MPKGSPRVAILMGSKNDWDVMKAAEQVLSDLDIASDARVISAHRTPDRLVRYLAGAEQSGIEVIIAGAGAAAHLAGVTAAHTLLPVLGVPIGSSELKGLDALLSTVQMPGGIPLMPTFHPAYVLRQYTPENRRAVWSDLKAALARARES